MRNSPLPAENMSSWKLLLITYAVLTPWAALAAFTPRYSFVVLTIGIILTMIGAIGAVLVGRGYSRWGQIAFGNALFLILLTTSGRSWMVVIGNILIWGIWMVVLLAIYILAWFLPSLDSDFSAFLWKEQYTPESKVGKAILNISARFLPIAGAGGALFGMYATRSGHDHLGLLFMGIAGALLSIALAQLTAHQFWWEDHQRKQNSGEIE